MKLKLEAVGEITVLCVSDDIPLAQCAVLKAGITKLIQSGKKRVLLDLVYAGTIAPEAVKEITALKTHAASLGGALSIASVTTGLNNYKTREEAISPLKHEYIQMRLAQLESERSALEKQLQSPALAGAAKQLRTERKRHTDLQRNCEELEKRIEELMKVRPGKPHRDARQAGIESTVSEILKKQGVL